MSAPAPGALPPRRPSSRARVLLVTVAAAFVVLLLWLGTWQVERRAWKLDLVARVEQRVGAVPVPAPERSRWPMVNAASDEYRHVSVTGMLLGDKRTLVQAVTKLGAGYWVLTPLRQVDGTTVLINMGFIEPGAVDRSRPPAAGSSASIGVASDTSGASDRTPVTITGLLRITEPKGGFLRSNDPAADRWYSRDVAAIAAARGLTNAAPYFVDADAAQVPTQPSGVVEQAPPTSGAAPATSGPADARAIPGAIGQPPPPNTSAGQPIDTPVGGLTVVTFHNNHLGYAITWYVLAAMVAFATWRLLKERRDDAADA